MSDVIRIGGEVERRRRPVRPVPPISWWDQERLRRRGARDRRGALGNEIVKNLALLGVGHVFVADRDRVENSNLSRSILFRESDCGRPKAEVAALRAAEIYPEIKVQPFLGNIVYDLGAGVYRWADVILGGLDNREARVAINLASRPGRQGLDRWRHRTARRRRSGLRPGHRAVLRMHNGRKRLEDARGPAKLCPALAR